MQKKIITALGIFLLLGVFGCGTQQENISQISVQPTKKEEQRQDKLSTLPDEIQDILYKDREFYDVERKQTYTKSSYQVDIWEYENDEKKKVYWEEYLVLDLDKDGQQELLVRIKNKNSPEPATRIFDVEEDTVYCYSYVYRATIQVYADGVILGSSGASVNAFYSLKFKNGKAEEIVVAESKYREGTTECDYLIEGQKVSSDDFFTYCDKYNSLGGEEWTPFDEHSKEQQEHTSSISPESTTKGNPEQDKLSALPDKIQDILYNNGEFYDVERKLTYTKSSYQVDI